MSPEPSSFHNRLFDWLAPLYDLSVWLAFSLVGGETVIRERVLAQAEPLTGADIIEICAGTATLSLMALKKGARAVVALDISQGMLDVAKEKARKENAHLMPVMSDAATMPFGDDAFDRAIVSIGLHEVRQGSLRQILCEIYRVLDRGGKLVIFDYHRAEGLPGLWQRIFFSFFETNEARVWVGTDLQERLRECGFRDFRRQFLAKRALQIVTVVK